MSDIYVYICIFIMAAATYLVRALPMTLIRGEIKNPFMKSFLHYVPFATISALILPDAIFCTAKIPTTASVISAIVGLLVAFYLSIKEKDLIIVCFIACFAVFITDKILGLE